MSTPGVRPREGAFVRGMGLLDATNLVMGVMIGSGIYLVTADIARQVGAPGWVLAVWLLAAIMTVCGALTYGELAGMFPRAGGQYVYLREAFSPLWGFLYGWTLFAVIQCGSIAAVAVAFAKYFGTLVPWISSTNVLVDFATLNVAGRPYPVVLSTQSLVGIAVMVLLTGVNAIALRAGKLVQNVFTVVKVATLAAIAIVGLASAQAGAALGEPGFWQASRDGAALSGLGLVGAFGAAMVGSLFASDAWNNITFAAGEVRNPQRNVPLSLVLGTGGVCLLYFLTNVAYLNVLPFAQVAGAAEDRVATTMMESLLPGTGVALVAVAVMISTFGCLNGMILAGPRLYYAMARDGLFFRATGKLGVKSGVPVRGLAYQLVWSMVLAMSGTYGELLDYTIFAALLFYALTACGLFVLRLRQPNAERPYRVWGYPWLPGAYLVLCATVMVVLLVEKPKFTWPGLILVATGIPVYYVWRLASRQPTEKA